MLYLPCVGQLRQGGREMRYEKAVLLFVLVVSFIAVVPSLALAEFSLNLGLGAAITQDEDVTVR